jgi:hypothetical protein
MEMFLWGVAAIAVVLTAAFAREYRQRVKRFKEMEARHDAHRRRVEEAICCGTRIASSRYGATHKAPPPPLTRYVNDSRRPSAAVAARAREEPAWQSQAPMSPCDYDPPAANFSSHGGSHHSFSGGGGSFDGGGSSGDWSSSDSGASSCGSDTGSSGCSSD